MTNQAWIPDDDELDTSVIETSVIAEKAHKWIIQQCETNGQLDAAMGMLFQQHITFKTIKELLKQGFISTGESK